MKNFNYNRYQLSALLTFFCFLPVAFFSLYSVFESGKSKSWLIVSSGWLLTCFSALTSFILLYYWEKKIKYSIAEIQEASNCSNKIASLQEICYFDQNKMDEVSLALEKAQEELSSLKELYEKSQQKEENYLQELEEREKKELSLLENNQILANKAEKVDQEFVEYRLFAEEQLKQKTLKLTNLELTVEEQRAEMEKRQEYISQLDSKVHDLSYEIKTLLNLNEKDSNPARLQRNEKKSIPFICQSRKIEPLLEDSQINIENYFPNQFLKTAGEALVLLRKYVKFAEKMTGGNYYHQESLRFKEFSSSRFTIDQRRLFDTLKNEKEAIILVYSSKENKLLFVNSQVQTILGCPSEDLINDFDSFFQDSLYEWKKAIFSLEKNPEYQTRFVVKTLFGHEVMLSTTLGFVTTGLFRNYVIGVLYPN